MKRGKIHSRKSGNSNKVLIIIASILFAAAALFASYWFFLKDTKKTTSNANNQYKSVSSEQKPQYDSAEGRYLFHGTIAWDRAIERDARGDVSRPFSLLNTFEKEKYDAWIADLECPSANTTVPYETQVNALIFNCPPKFNAEARKYFDILNLANNHTHDLGYERFLETQKNLTDAGFQIVGSQDLTDKKNHCEVMSMPIRLKKDNGEDVKENLPIAFCAYHAVSRSPNQEELQSIKDYAAVMPVFAFAHAGIEYVATATEQQRQIGRDLIDAGAEFVIMNHAHWVQDTDVYKGKLVVYATGNFIYDQLEYDTQRSASYDVKMTTEYNETLQQWIELGKTCNAVSLHDDCLSQIPDGLEKPNFNYVYDLVAGDERPPQRWLARKADETLQLDTEKRANWLETLQKLGQTERLNQ